MGVQNISSRDTCNEILHKVRSSCFKTSMPIYKDLFQLDDSFLCMGRLYLICVMGDGVENTLAAS